VLSSKTIATLLVFVRIKRQKCHDLLEQTKTGEHVDIGSKSFNQYSNISCEPFSVLQYSISVCTIELGADDEVHKLDIFQDAGQKTVIGELRAIVIPTRERAFGLCQGSFHENRTEIWY